MHIFSLLPFLLDNYADADAVRICIDIGYSSAAENGADEEPIHGQIIFAPVPDL